MEEKDNKDDLFEIRLNREGAASVMRFVKTAKWVFVIMLLEAAISITQEIVYSSIFKARYFAGNKLVLFQHKLQPFTIILYFLIIFIQTWYYWQTAKKLSQSLRDSNEHQFNQAFHLLYRHSVFAVLTLTFGFVIIAFDFFVLVKSYSHSFG